MATVLNQPRHHHAMIVRSSLQKICIGIGIFFIIVGVVGIIVPGFMGLHLSTAHNLIHLASGVLALWCGYSDINSRAYNFCIAFGSVYGLLGLAGFVLGEPGYPAVGFTRADENLLRVIPNVLEFGTMDHIVHLAVSALLLVSAYFWKRDALYKTDRTTVDTQARTGIFRNEKNEIKFHRTSEDAKVKPPELGAEDLNHISKIKERTDYEKRI